MLDKIRDFFTFGKDEREKNKKIVFYIGLIPILLFCYTLSIDTAHVHSKSKLISQGAHRVVRGIRPDWTSGIITGLVTLVLLIIIWRFLVDKIAAVFHDEESSVFLKRFFIIGEAKVDKIISILFYSGLILGLVFPLIPGINLARIFFYIDPRALMNNIVLIVFFNIIGYLIFAVLWKISCELLLVIFRCFETYYESKKKHL